jgi:hypothetical protein
MQNAHLTFLRSMIGIPLNKQGHIYLMSTTKKQPIVFKVALDVPWNDWPEELDEHRTAALLSVLYNIEGTVASDINSITSLILSGNHNVLVAAKLSDGFPFFLHHFPSSVYASSAYLFVISEDSFITFLKILKVEYHCRCLSLHINESHLSGFQKFGFSKEYPDIRTVKKLISKTRKPK